MDVLMPKMDGVEACGEIMGSAPDTKVLMLTVAREQDAVMEAIAAGATGYLQKETDSEQLLSAVRGVHNGELRAPVDIVRRVFTEMRKGANAVDPADAAGLTTREREILASFAQGMSYLEIANGRGIKSVSVRNAIYRIQQKLEIGTMQGLVHWAIRNGLLDKCGPDAACCSLCSAR